MKIFDKNNPFPSRILERYCLNSPDSSKKTFHLCLDLEGSGIQYKVGDSLAIFPMNDPETVDLLISHLNYSEKYLVKTRKEQILTIKDFFLYHANLSKTPKKLVELIASQTGNYLTLLEEKDLLKNFLNSNTPLEVLLDNKTFSINPQDFCDLLPPLLPRFYSIASSMKKVGQQAHLTVALNLYETENKIRKGTCSSYLCELAPLMQPVVSIYLQSSEDFTLPQESFDKPIVMVGPGTGVAPFRGFMQERQSLSTSSNWLFFGERNRHSDFLYENDWKEFENLGLLKLDLAFSRDQPEKIYVHHKLREQGQELWRWLENGAYFYVCGDASRMAKDVDAALFEIIQIFGNKDAESAKLYLKSLKTQKRYLKDIY